MKKKYNYEYYLKNSKKLKKFLDTYKNRTSTHRAYKLHLVRFFEYMNIKDVDNYIKDTRIMDKKEKIKYLDKLEEDLTQYWIYLNNEAKGKTPYIWLSGIKMFLIQNKTFELDDVYMRLQKNGHGNYTITNTKTPTKEQLLKIFSYSNPESKALFMFQLTSGQRIGQVVETTFDNIELDYDCPRIFYPKTKQKYIVKTRITPEAKKYLEEYLDQRQKFIDIRIKRGEHRRRQELDTDKVFPMDEGTANAMWTIMVKNAGLYELDPHTKKPLLGTHCLRRFFLSHFSDRDWGDYFSGHVTPRNKEYRQYPDERLDEEYNKHLEELNIFSTRNKDVKKLNEEMTKKDEEIQDLKKKIESMDQDLRKLMIERLTE